MDQIQEVRARIEEFDKEIEKLPIGSHRRLQLITAREPLVAWLRFKLGGKT